MLVYQTLRDFVSTYGESMFYNILTQLGHVHRMIACSFENQIDQLFIIHDDTRPTEFVSFVFAPNYQMQIIGMQTEETVNQTIATFHNIINKHHNHSPSRPLEITIDVAHPQVSFEYRDILHILDKLGYSNIHYNSSAKVCGSHYTDKCPNATLAIPAYTLTQSAVSTVASGSIMDQFEKIVVEKEMHVRLSPHIVSLMRGHVEDDYVEIYGYLKLDKLSIAHNRSYRPMRIYQLISGTVDSVNATDPMLAGFHTHPAEIFANKSPWIIHPSSSDLIALTAASITQSAILQYVATPDGIYRFSLTRLFTVYLGIIIRSLADELETLTDLIRVAIIDWESAFKTICSAAYTEMEEEFRREEVDRFHEKWLSYWNTLTFNQLFITSKQPQYFDSVTRHISQQYALDMTDYYDNPIFSFTFTHWNDIENIGLLDTIEMPLYHGMAAPLIY